MHIERHLPSPPIMPKAQARKDAPERPLYRRLFRTTQTIRVEPTYVAGVSPSFEFLGVRGMDQSRQRHLSPPFHMSQTDIRKYLSWQPVVLPPLKLTGHTLRQVLRESPNSTPFHDRLEYRMYQRWYQGENISSTFWGDFYALPNTLPHGPIANGRPLLNFTTSWNVFSSVLKRHLTPVVSNFGIIPPLQFALYGGSSAVDVLRVVHDTDGFKESMHCCCWMMSDTPFSAT